MLRALTERTTLTCLGLMSGTSCDGIDTAIVRVGFEGKGLSAAVLAGQTVPYPPEIRHLLLNAGRLTAADLATANFTIGHLFADAARRTWRAAGLRGNEIDLIASHGHTIVHDPPHATLQIGEGAVIAQETGRLTVTDFRVADVAAGGQGAPLVALLDTLLLCPPGSKTAALNIGGIANISCPVRGSAELLAFDTGPGNMPIDAAVRLATGDAQTYDRDGAMAAAGTVPTEAAARFLAAEPYFRREPPKTTGRETFGDAWLQRLGAACGLAAGADLVATATWVTARSIVAAVTDFALPAAPLERLIVSGGGAHNGHLLALIRAGLPSLAIEKIDRDGFTVDNKEAAAFALLGAFTARRMPANIPSATGAGVPAVLGKVSFPPPDEQTDAATE